MQKIKLQNRKGQTIVGILEKPDDEIKGTCVIQHGWGGTKEQPQVQIFKDVFLKNGFQTFNFDTTNSFGESDGKYSKSRLGLHYEDLEDVAKWVQEQNWFKAPLALTGHSMGGYSIVRYAEKYPDEVAYLMPIAPVVSGKLTTEAFMHYNPKEFRKWEQDGVLVKESLSTLGLIKKSPWETMIEWQNHDLLPNAHKLTMPIFLLSGSKDTTCPSDHVQQLYDAIPEGNKTYKIIEGAPHTYRTEKDLVRVKTLMDEWLKSIL